MTPAEGCANWSNSVLLVKGRASGMTPAEGRGRGGRRARAGHRACSDGGRTRAGGSERASRGLVRERGARLGGGRAPHLRRRCGALQLVRRA